MDAESAWLKAFELGAQEPSDVPSEELRDSLLRTRLELDSACHELRKGRERNSMLLGELSVVRALMHQAGKDQPARAAAGGLEVPPPVDASAQQQEPDLPDSWMEGPTSGGGASSSAELTSQVWELNSHLDGVWEQLRSERETGQALSAALDTSHLLLLTGGAADEPRSSGLNLMLSRWGDCCWR